MALVTGASRGIGAACAEALAAAGAHVVLTARDVKALELVEERIHAAGGQATIAPLDLTEPDGIARLAAAIGQRWPALDMLLLNAAVLPQLTSVVDIDPRAFNTALTTNALATQALLAAFHPLLRKAAGARVIGLTNIGRQGPARLLGCLCRQQGRAARCCWNAMRRKPATSRKSASPSSIPARPARRCAPAPIRAKIRPP